VKLFIRELIAIETMLQTPSLLQLQSAATHFIYKTKYTPTTVISFKWHRPSSLGSLLVWASSTQGIGWLLVPSPYNS
jgi:hypothetical protein